MRKLKIPKKYEKIIKKYYLTLKKNSVTYEHRKIKAKKKPCDIPYVPLNIFCALFRDYNNFFSIDTGCGKCPFYKYYKDRKYRKYMYSCCQFARELTKVDRKYELNYLKRAEFLKGHDYNHILEGNFNKACLDDYKHALKIAAQYVEFI
jgi:hypothetical protein